VTVKIVASLTMVLAFMAALREQGVGERPIRVEYPSATEALACCQLETRRHGEAATQ